MGRWAIQAFGLTKHYGGRPVLRGVSLSVAPGEICAVVGEAGAGKSVLLRVLSTVTPADGGSFYVDGCPVLAWHRHRADLAAIRGRIGYVPPAPGQPGGLTGWESGLFFALHHGLDVRTARHRLGALFEQLNLDRVAQRPAATYSPEHRYALAVAQALVHAPSVLLLDGPRDAAGPQVQPPLARLLRAEAHSGTAVLLALRTGSSEAPDLHGDGHQGGTGTPLYDQVQLLSQGTLLACEPLRPEGPASGHSQGHAARGTA